MPAAVYSPRKPQNSPYYQCVEDHFEAFEGICDDRFQRTYGFFRPYAKEVICRYLDCGVLHNGFARIVVETVVMNISYPFPIKGGTFATPITRSTWEFGQWLCKTIINPRKGLGFKLRKIEGVDSLPKGTTF